MVSLGLAVCWALSWASDWQVAFQLEQVVAHILLAAIYTGISILLIKFFNDTIGQMKPVLGICLAWLLVVLVAAGIPRSPPNLPIARRVTM